MALQQFWSAIQNARSLFFGRMNESVGTGRRTDTMSLMDAVAQTADVWFTPDLVKEFGESDFAFLSDDERLRNSGDSPHNRKAAHLTRSDRPGLRPLRDDQ